MSPLIKYFNRDRCARMALLLLVACIPVNVHALGFGKPLVASSLGEPLRILLPLTALEQNEIDDLVARLAAPSWFQLSGLDYGEINDQLIVSVDKEMSSLVISTQQPVSQVVVPLVIELEGPRKIMRKQFTVLINPASYDQAVTSAGSGNTLASTLNLAEGITGNSESVSDRAEPVSAETTGLSSGSTSATAQNTDSGASGSGSTGASLVGNESVASSPLPARADRVIVAKGESLSTIVDRFLPNGANRYQGRMAFYNVNPEAFPQGNIHTLTSGAELLVPPEQDILALPAAQARRDYQALASLPVPGAATAVAETSGQANASNESGQTAGQQQKQDQQAGFTLSLLEVDEEETTEENPAAPENNFIADNPVTEGADETASGAPLAMTSTAAGEQFEMQGFTMKLSVMNAYIVELQEENQELKSRVAALEEKVQALIARESGGGEPMALADQADTPVASVDTADQAEIGAEDTTVALADNAADSTRDLASVLARSPEMLALDESDEGLTSALQKYDEALGIDTFEEDPTTVDTDTGSDISSSIADEPVTPVEELAGTNSPSETLSEQNLNAEVTNTVDQMLAELDAELNGGDTSSSQPQGIVEQAPEVNVAPDENDSAEEQAEIVRNSVDQTESETALPQATFRQGLLEKAQTMLSGLNGPILQLLIAVLLLAALLFAWMMRRGNKSVVAQSNEPEISTHAANNPGAVGVTYTTDNQISILEDGDEEDEQWLAQQDVSMENLDTLEGSDVDLITQSEVYLTYNRPMQAVQALMEEYSKKDTDKFVVGTRLIKVFEKIGSSDERNTAMRNFIVTLNNDIEEFTNSEWDALRFDLDALRRHEQVTALEHSDETSVDMNSFNQLDEQQENRGAPKLDESVIDLDFHVTDKSG